MANIHTMRKLCPDEELREMYEARMMTTVEIGNHFGCSGGKVAADLRRIGVVIRKASSRHPKKGEENVKWKGDKASYSAFHYRVVSHRGRPQKCEKCGTTEGKMQWANLTGKYDDPQDYSRFCIPCHRRFDYERRLQTGKMTSLNGSKDGIFRLTPRTILTVEQIEEARKLRSEQWTWVSLGIRYGVCGNAIRSAVIGKNWRHLSKKDGDLSTGR